MKSGRKCRECIQEKEAIYGVCQAEIENGFPVGNFFLKARYGKALETTLVFVWLVTVTVIKTCNLESKNWKMGTCQCKTNSNKFLTLVPTF